MEDKYCGRRVHSTKEFFQVGSYGWALFLFEIVVLLKEKFTSFIFVHFISLIQSISDSKSYESLDFDDNLQQYKQKQQMSALKKPSVPVSQRKSVSIQLQPEILEPQPDIGVSFNPSSFKKQINNGNHNHTPKINKLINNIEDAELNRSKQLLQQKKNQQNAKRIKVNKMKLRDLRFQLSKNIFNIAIGELQNRDSYIQGMHQQINGLRQKIKNIQEQDNNSRNSSYKQTSSIDDSKARSIDRKTFCGRIYRRLNTPSTENQQVNKSVRKNQKQESSFYKWKPQYDIQSFSQMKSTEHYRSNQFGYNTINPNDLSNKPNFRLQMKTAKTKVRYDDNGQKDKNHYRSANKSMTMTGRPTFNRNPQYSDHYNKTDSLNNGNKYRATKENGVKSNKRPNIQGQDLLINREELMSNITKPLNYQQPINEKKFIQSKPYQNKNSLKIPPQPIQKKNEKIKQQKIFKRYVQQWQINNVFDDFRQKINKKLQVPQQFTLPQIQSQQSIEQSELKIKNAYASLGVKSQNQPNLVVRKFKNGIFGSIGPEKNIVWYLNGSFYYGCWDSDLPTEGQKHGFGFEYIPNKYIYVGSFKFGMKTGRGVLKMLSGDKQNFMAYDGEWQNGKPHGFGKQIDENNTKYIGNFINGQKTGDAVILTSQNLHFQGKVIKGLKHGTGVERLMNGDVYIGQFADNKFNGIGKYKWANGSVHEGYFVNGKRQGQGKWKSSSGDQFEGQYFEDLKNGWGKFTWSNGEVYEGEFKNDFRNGEGTYRHPSGKVGKFLWKDGEIVHRLYCEQQQQYRCRNKVEKDEEKITS